jgi:hypothetical protein
LPPITGTSSPERQPLPWKAGLRSKSDGCPFRRGRQSRPKTGLARAGAQRLPGPRFRSLGLDGRGTQCPKTRKSAGGCPSCARMEAAGQDALASWSTTAVKAPDRYPCIGDCATRLRVFLPLETGRGGTSGFPCSACDGTTISPLTATCSTSSGLLNSSLL